MQTRTKMQAQAHAVGQCRTDVQARLIFLLNLESKGSDLFAQIWRHMLRARNARQALLVAVNGQHDRYEAMSGIIGCSLRPSARCRGWIRD